MITAMPLKPVHPAMIPVRSGRGRDKSAMMDAPVVTSSSVVRGRDAQGAACDANPAKTRSITIVPQTSSIVRAACSTA